MTSNDLFRPCRSAAVAVTLALLASTSAVAAQSGGTPTSDAKAQAGNSPGTQRPATTQPAPAGAPDEVSAWFKQAEAARDEGRFEEAATLLRKAWDQRKTWDIAGNLGLMEKKLGQLVPAAEHLSFALANLPPTVDEDARIGLTKAFTAVRAEVAAVRLRVNVEGADVKVGGDARGKSPIAEAFVTPGRVTIEVTKEGFDAAERTAEMKKGETQEVTINLHAKEAPPPPRSMVPAFVIGGVSVASLVAGGVVYGVSTTTGAELRAGAPRGSEGQLLCRKTLAPASAENAECNAWRAKAGEAAILGNAGIGLFVVGGVAAAGAIAAYLLWPASAPSRAANAWHVTPVVDAQGGGAILQGSF